jgi:hypothetical protein
VNLTERAGQVSGTFGVARRPMGEAKRTAAIVVAFLAAGGCSGPAVPNSATVDLDTPSGEITAPVPNDFPPGWKMADIEAAAYPRDKGHVYVLAWRITQDDRPLRVENCLAVKVSPDNTGEKPIRFFGK